MRFKRSFIRAVHCLAMIIGTLSRARDCILYALITHQLDDIGARAGEQTLLESATQESLEHVTLRGLLVDDDRWVCFERVERCLLLRSSMRLESPTLSSGVHLL